MKVKYKGCDQDQINFGGHDDPRKLLKIGKTYEVFKKEVHDWHTHLILKKFRDKRFNSVCFEEKP